MRWREKGEREVLERYVWMNSPTHICLCRHQNLDKCCRTSEWRNCRQRIYFHALALPHTAYVFETSLRSIHHSSVPPGKTGGFSKISFRTRGFFENFEAKRGGVFKNFNTNFDKVKKMCFIFLYTDVLTLPGPRGGDFHLRFTFFAITFFKMIFSKNPTRRKIVRVFWTF